MVRDWLQKRYRQGTLALSKLGAILFVGLLLFSLFYPVVASSGAEPSVEAPTLCVENPDRTVSNTSSGAISATASQSAESNDVVNISYDIDEDDQSFTLDMPIPTQTVGTSGFREYQFKSADLELNTSADEHWIAYRTDPSQIDDLDSEDSATQLEYPSSNDSVVGLIPDHSRNVSIDPETAGYVGSNTIYLGEYETTSRTVGCQKLVVVEMGDSPLTFDANDRLDYMEAAARSADNGQRFETVTAFVDAKIYGEMNGVVYRFENDIVISDPILEPHPSLVWIHEYVHTLQNYDAGEDMRWSYEGMAEYLSYKIALENDFISPLYHDSGLSNGHENSSDSDLLLNQSTREPIAYDRGSAMFSQLDQDLEKSNKSIYDVFHWLNTSYKPTYERLKEYLVAEANLSSSTVESYDRIVYDTEQIELDSESRLPKHIPQSWLPYTSSLITPQMRLVVFLFGLAKIYNMFFTEI